MIFRKTTTISACTAYMIFMVVQVTIAAPITFNTALPVAKDELVFRVQTKLLRSSHDQSAANRSLTVSSIPVVAVYGIRENLALFGILPIIHKEIELDTPTGRVNRSLTGLGDLNAMVRYTAWKSDQPGRTTRVAPFIALEIPTGLDNKVDNIGVLPQPLQLGSGSWDPAMGVVVTRQSLSRQIDAAISYKFNTQANNFQFGDIGRFDLSYQHRVWPRVLANGVPGFLYGVVESNLVWQDKNKISGVDDNDSGGIFWYLAPGIQYVTRRAVAEAAVQLPILQNLNGSALENDFIYTVSFRMNF